MASVKVAIIGGGSAYCAGLLEAFVRAGDRLRGSELCLMDIHSGNLEIIWKLGSRMAQASGGDLRITRTERLEEAIRDSDFVLTTFRAGGLEARVLDEKIPLRHGVIGQETQGPGGFFLALRSIPTLQQIVGLMERHVPNAFLLNYTNPVNILVEAIARHSPLNVIGLCEGPILFSRQVAKACGVDPDTVEIETLGVNHANWSTRFAAGGNDMIAVAVEAAPSITADMTLSGSLRRMFRLIERFGRLPSEYLQYYYYTEELLTEQRAKPRTRAETLLGGLDRYFDHYREEAEKERPVLRMYRGRIDLGRFTILGDFAVHVLDAIANDRGERFTLNVPNRGATAQFPDGRVVEVPVVVDRRSAHPLPVPQIEPELAQFLQSLAEYQHQTAVAGWRGTRSDAVAAMAMDPLVGSRTKAEAIYSEMAAAHRPYLPARLQ